jgi:hypothetical protein
MLRHIGATMKTTTIDRFEARAFYIPAGAQKFTCKISGAVAYLHTNAAGKPAALGFSKNAIKPTFRFYFSSDKAREVYVSLFFTKHAAHVKRRSEQEAKRKAFVHSLQVGAVLYSTWGYDQTNCDFYQVTRVIGRCVMIRRIGAESVSSNGAAMTGSVIAMKDRFSGPELRKLVGENNSVKVSSFSWASLWDGRPVGISSYA